MSSLNSHQFFSFLKYKFIFLLRNQSLSECLSNNEIKLNSKKERKKEIKLIHY